MHWQRLGKIFAPSGDLKWSQSHAQVPVADYDVHQNVIRVFFSTRDTSGKSRPGCVVLDADNPLKVLEVSQKPILPLGELGEFDDCGVMPSWLLNHPNGQKFLYYIGWNVRNTIPYHNAIGLATSKDGGNSFQKPFRGPLWDRDYLEPHYSGTTCVLFDDGKFKNWYLNCTQWVDYNGRLEPRYHIKYAESADGINWSKKGEVAIDYVNEEEGGIVKASVLKMNKKYHMWYSYRKLKDYRTRSANSYRIGHAISSDGLNWERCDGDELSLGTSNESWENFMVCYPHVFKVNNRVLMLYNGNGFGQTGFGIAELYQ